MPVNELNPAMNRLNPYVSAPVLVTEPSTSDIAIVVCGGGNPFAEYEQAMALVRASGKQHRVFAGNDQIEHFPDHLHDAVTLHPDKLPRWLERRTFAGRSSPERIWSHRNTGGRNTHWTKDWAGSTGLFCVKIAREQGFTHIILCGVHMSPESDHFVRKTPWNAATGFMRGWLGHMTELKPYIRSFGGWTERQFGRPDLPWVVADIEENYSVAPTGVRA